MASFRSCATSLWDSEWLWQDAGSAELPWVPKGPAYRAHREPIDGCRLAPGLFGEATLTNVDPSDALNSFLFVSVSGRFTSEPASLRVDECRFSSGVAMLMGYNVGEAAPANGDVVVFTWGDTRPSWQMPHRRKGIRQR